MRRLPPTAAAFAALALMHPAAAQETTLPESVITATRVPTKIERVPAGVTVIDRATIQSRGYNSLVDALSAVPGLRVVQSGGDGSNASVFTRGTNSNATLVLRDGVPINDPSDPGGAFNFGVDPLGDIERIEVVRGPMSGVYGAGAIGGVINIITRRASATPQASVDLAAGLPASGRAIGSLTGTTGKFDYSIQAQGQGERGFDNTPQRMSVYNGERDGYSGGLAAAELGFTPISRTSLSWKRTESPCLVASTISLVPCVIWTSMSSSPSSILIALIPVERGLAYSLSADFFTVPLLVQKSRY